MATEVDGEYWNQEERQRIGNIKRIADLEQQVASLKAEREWISVKDRLPKEGESNRVIVFADKRAPFLPEVLWGYYERGHWHTQWGRCDRITHWMPMPEPPAQQQPREGEQMIRHQKKEF